LRGRYGCIGRAGEHRSCHSPRCPVWRLGGVARRRAACRGGDHRRGQIRNRSPVVRRIHGAVPCAHGGGTQARCALRHSFTLVARALCMRSRRRSRLLKVVLYASATAFTVWSLSPRSRAASAFLREVRGTTGAAGRAASAGLPFGCAPSESIGRRTPPLPGLLPQALGPRIFLFRAACSGVLQVRGRRRAPLRSGDR